MDKLTEEENQLDNKPKVYRPGGTKPIFVEELTSDGVSGYYKDGTHQNSLPLSMCYTGPVSDPSRKCLAYIDYEAYLNQTQGENQMTKLYETTQDNKTIYVEFLAKDRSGKWVVQEKDTDKVLQVKPEDCQEVKPYTVAVQASPKAAHYECEEGDVNIGDYLLSKSGGLYQVTHLDTKANTKYSLKEVFVGKIPVTPFT